MLLDNKHAVVYGAGGRIGAAVARGFAREGARASLAGRTRAKLDELAQAISAGSGNVADVAQVDALDEQAILRHADRLTMTGSGAPTAGMGGAMTAWGRPSMPCAGSWRANSDRTASGSCGCARTAWLGMRTTQPSESGAC